MNNFWLDRKESSSEDVAEMMESYRSQCEEEYLAKAQLLEDEYNTNLAEAYEQF